MTSQQSAGRRAASRPRRRRGRCWYPALRRRRRRSSVPSPPPTSTSGRRPASASPPDPFARRGSGRRRSCPCPAVPAADGDAPLAAPHQPVRQHDRVGIGTDQGRVEEWPASLAAVPRRKGPGRARAPAPHSVDTAAADPRGSGGAGRHTGGCDELARSCWRRHKSARIRCSFAVGRCRPLMLTIIRVPCSERRGRDRGGNRGIDG